MGVLVCGIDEAGRGPVFGSFVIGCAIFDEEGKEKLKALNVRDSKKVAPKRREMLEVEIKKIAIEWTIAKITPEEIDRLRKKESLNSIEAKKIGGMIMKLEKRADRILIDSPDTIAGNFEKRIREYIMAKKPSMHIPEIISEHKADENYIEVSAASILAKVERDREIKELAAKFGDFGSGYPSDERTQKFLAELKKKGNLPYFVRKSWSPAGIINSTKQATLFD